MSATSFWCHRVRTIGPRIEPRRLSYQVMKTRPKTKKAAALTDSELDEVLRSTRVPGRKPNYWRKFPRQVVKAVIRSSDGRPVSNEGKTPP